MPGVIEMPELNRRILVIDDQEAIHEDFRRILQTSCATKELDDLEDELFGSDEGPAEGGETSADGKGESAEIIPLRATDDQ